MRRAAKQTADTTSIPLPRQPRLDGLLLPQAAPSGTRAPLRLASGARVRGPEKYRLLEHRRRQAQIKARHLLELADRADGRAVRNAVAGG